MPGASSPPTPKPASANGPGAIWEPKSPRLALVPQLRERIIDRTAAWLSARGVTRIALYGAGRHTRPIIRQPWLLHGIEVAAIIDDDPPREDIAGVPVTTLAEALARGDFQAVVISSTEFEDQMAERAASALRGTAIELVRLYTPDDTLWESRATEQRLIERGLDPAEARWLVENRGERHDALLPIIPPARTELHARRYELAAEVLRAISRRSGAAELACADVACGTGYGSAILAKVGRAGRVIGVDLDPDTIAYAARQYGGEGIELRVAPAGATGIETESMDLAASFETVEHVEDAAGMVEELHRVLRPGGRLVISTPNRIGPTPYHVHDFGFPEFRALLEARFEVLEWIGQLPADDIHAPDLPPGMWRLDPHRAEREDWRSGSGEGGGGRPGFLIAVCRKGDRGQSGGQRSASRVHEAVYRWLSGAAPSRPGPQKQSTDPEVIHECTRMNTNGKSDFHTRHPL